jgi:quercetin dioxygenase-like cupin family protein
VRIFHPALTLALGPAVLLGPAALAAQGAVSPSGQHAHAIVALAGTEQWGPAPAILPPGARLAVLEGDPAQPGPFTMRLLIPAGYRIPPHFHPVVEHVTVIRGTFQVGMGEQFDPAKLTDLPAGTFAALSPGTRHFAQAKVETVIQLHGVGPWGLTYVNPADDPRKAQP